MNRILVTGGAGFIGANLVHRLVRTGHQVLVLDKLTYAGNLQSLAAALTLPNCHFSRTDLTDLDAVQRQVQDFRPDWVAHLAAESHVDRSIDGPGQFIDTNILGTFNLLQAARGYWSRLPGDQARRFRLVHVSTDEVYGSLGQAGLFTELTRYDPHSPYSASKAAADHLVRAWHATYGLPTLVTNCSNNYGPYQFPEKLIPVVILKCLRGEPIPVYGAGANVRDWLFVEDHCEALEMVLERGVPGQTYNIGGGQELSNIELVRRVCRLMDRLAPPTAGAAAHDSLIEFVADRPGHDFRYAIDATKIRQELGWIPRHALDSALVKTVQWYLDHAAWWQDILSGSYRLERLGVAPAQPG